MAHSDATVVQSFHCTLLYWLWANMLIDFETSESLARYYLQSLPETLRVGAQVSFAGLSQIVLQNSAMVGFLIFAGSALNSVPLALMGLLGSVTGSIVALLLKRDKAEICQGLYGFNAALVGFGLGYFYGSSLAIVPFVVLGAAVSSVIMWLLTSVGVRPFTFPFVVTTWGLMLVFSIEPLFDRTVNTPQPSEVNAFIHAVSLSFGQVFFQEYFLTGVIFILAITVFNPIAGVFGIAAAILGFASANMFNLQAFDISQGLYGYNAVLCAIAFSGLRTGNFICATFSVLLSILIFQVFLIFGLPALTFPFVLSAWVTGYFQSRYAII